MAEVDVLNVDYLDQQIYERLISELVNLGFISLPREIKMYSVEKGGGGRAYVFRLDSMRKVVTDEIRLVAVDPETEQDKIKALEEHGLLPLGAPGVDTFAYEIKLYSIKVDDYYQAVASLARLVAEIAREKRRDPETMDIAEIEDELISRGVELVKKTRPDIPDSEARRFVAVGLEVLRSNDAVFKIVKGFAKYYLEYGMWPQAFIAVFRVGPKIACLYRIIGSKRYPDAGTVFGRIRSTIVLGVPPDMMPTSDEAIDQLLYKVKETIEKVVAENARTISMFCRGVIEQRLAELRQ